MDAAGNTHFFRFRGTVVEAEVSWRREAWARPLDVIRL